MVKVLVSLDDNQTKKIKVMMAKNNITSKDKAIRKLIDKLR